MADLIRTMRPREIETALDMAAAEGWNPGIHDGKSFYTTDPTGFFVSEKDGEIIGTISAVAYDDSYGFIGFYIMKAEYRGEKYGSMLGLRAMKYLGDRNIGLDGVLERQDNYSRLGFNYAYKNIRFEGRDMAGRRNEHLKVISLIDFNKVAKYDSLCFPVPRPNFLKNWLSMINTTSVGYMDGDKLCGYGTLRSCRSGFKIGPLFADTPEIAEDILLGLAYHTKGKPFYFDTPQKNKAAVDLAQKYNMTEVFATARMYSKQEPNIDMDKMFGITSFELG